MKPTDELKNEHQAIKLMLKIMAKVCDRLDTHQNVEATHLDRIVEFIQVFADKCHHAKEEDLLFPAMIAAGVPKEGGPIGVMLIEHAKGREFVRNVKNNIAGFKSDEAGASELLSENARGYVSLLGPHIDKEDFILYPMADRVIPAALQKQLLKDFEKVEEEIVGHGKHEEFHELLERLQALYL
jgi:hemerythrin-like domain-containing protein